LITTVAYQLILCRFNNPLFGASAMESGAGEDDGLAHKKLENGIARPYFSQSKDKELTNE